MAGQLPPAFHQYQHQYSMDPVYTAQDTMSGILSSKLDPQSALAAYLGLHNALARSTDPGSGPSNRLAHKAAIAPFMRQNVLGSEMRQSSGPSYSSGGGGASRGSSFGGHGSNATMDVAGRSRAEMIRKEQEDAMLRSLGLGNQEQMYKNQTRAQIVNNNAVSRILEKLLSRY